MNKQVDISNMCDDISNMCVYMVSIHLHTCDMHICTPHMKCVADIMYKFTKGIPYVAASLKLFITRPYKNLTKCLCFFPCLFFKGPKNPKTTLPHKKKSKFGFI